MQISKGSYLRSRQKDDNVVDFTPGVFEEFAAVKQAPSERQQRSVLVFGRGDAEDFKLKGFDISGKAVAELEDTCLVFVGAPDGKLEEIANRLTECGVPASRLRVRGFLPDRESLKRLFQDVDLVVMPSRTEGFGLTGLEALSAGLPVLVSHNSGFGEVLCSVPYGSLSVIRDLKQPGRVCGRRREKTSEVWVENVVLSGKNKCLSKLPSRLVAEVGRLH